jgi:hypothetical protein
MTSRLTNLQVPFVFHFAVTTSGIPEQLSVKRSAATIAFNENTGSPDTITDSASGFLVAGFQPGDTITVSGSVSNDGNYVVDTVTAGTITLKAHEDLTAEIAGAAVKITANKNIPDGIGVTIKARNANTLLMYLGYSSETALNTADAAFTLDNNESVGLQIHELKDLWLDADVNGEGVEVIFEKGLQE